VKLVHRALKEKLVLMVKLVQQENREKLVLRENKV
jgi:hypothetical protein